MTNLNGIIEEIRSKGVSEAQAKATSIISEAEEQSRNLLRDADIEAKKRLLAADEQVQQLEERTKAALKQAHRDLLLAVENDLKTKVSGYLAAEVNASLHGKTLQDTIVQVFSKWESKEGSVDLILNEKDEKELAASLVKELQKDAQAGLQLLASASVPSGFKVSIKDSSVIYDFTGKEISDALGNYLNTGLVELLKA